MGFKALSRNAAFLGAFAVLVHVFLGVGALGSLGGVGGIAPARADGGPPSFDGAARSFTLVRPPREAPFRTIRDRDGEPVDMARYRGKVLLVNFWATWCAPCVIEMPTLDRLQADMGGEDFAVLTISVDKRGMEVVGPFFEKEGYKHLPLLFDSSWDTLRAFGGQALPVTYLIDREGRIAGYLEGHAEWDSEPAKRLIRHYLARDAKP